MMRKKFFTGILYRKYGIFINSLLVFLLLVSYCFFVFAIRNKNLGFISIGSLNKNNSDSAGYLAITMYNDELTDCHRSLEYCAINRLEHSPLIVYHFPVRLIGISFS